MTNKYFNSTVIGETILLKYLGLFIPYKTPAKVHYHKLIFFKKVVADFYLFLVNTFEFKVFIYKAYGVTNILIHFILSSETKGLLTYGY